MTTRTQQILELLNDEWPDPESRGQLGLVLGEYAGEIDREGTRFLNDLALYPQSPRVGCPTGSASQPGPEGELRAVVLSGTQEILRKRHDNGGWEEAGYVQQWLVIPQVDHSTLPAYVTGEGLSLLDLYPPTTTFCDNSGVFHFTELAEALEWAENLRSALGEHGIELVTYLGLDEYDPRDQDEDDDLPPPADTAHRPARAGLPRPEGWRGGATDTGTATAPIPHAGEPGRTRHGHGRSGESTPRAGAIPGPGWLVYALAVMVLLAAITMGTSREAAAQEAGDGSYDAAELEMVELINGYRADHGLEPVQVSDTASLASKRHSEDMATYDFFDHHTMESSYFPSGAYFDQRMDESGYAYNTNRSENIAAGQEGADATLQQWIDSPEHNENMLTAEWDVIGIGLDSNPDSTYTYYWTTTFGAHEDETATDVSELAGTTPGQVPESSEPSEPSEQADTPEPSEETEPSEPELTPEEREDVTPLPEDMTPGFDLIDDMNIGDGLSRGSAMDGMFEGSGDSEEATNEPSEETTEGDSVSGDQSISEDQSVSEDQSASGDQSVSEGDTGETSQQVEEVITQENGDASDGAADGDQTGPGTPGDPAAQPEDGDEAGDADSDDARSIVDRIMDSSDLGMPEGLGSFFGGGATAGDDAEEDTDREAEETTPGENSGDASGEPRDMTNTTGPEDEGEQQQPGNEPDDAGHQDDEEPYAHDDQQYTGDEEPNTDGNGVTGDSIMDGGEADPQNGEPAGGQAERDGEADATATIARVIDGDTVELEEPVEGEDTVRLIGVDTPETVHPEKDPEPYGEEASQFATEALEGEEVELELDEELIDPYDRLLAYIWIPAGMEEDHDEADQEAVNGEAATDELFNETLIREGYGEVLIIEPNDRYADVFEEAEAEAREEERGLWGLDESTDPEGAEPESTEPEASDPDDPFTGEAPDQEIPEEMPEEVPEEEIIEEVPEEDIIEEVPEEEIVEQEPMEDETGGEPATRGDCGSVLDGFDKSPIEDDDFGEELRNRIQEKVDCKLANSGIDRGSGGSSNGASDYASDYDSDSAGDTEEDTE